MKTFTPFALGLSVLVSQACSHYIFEKFTGPDGTQYPTYQYIRENTNDNSPVTDLTSVDLRCNVGATGSGTETITVAAGDTVAFTSDVAVYHDGPISFYMAKAPTTAAAFDGSGQVWFKIKDIGPVFDASGTATWNLLQTYQITLPAALPSGDYLLRIQSLAIHNPWPAGIPQFYTECAQLTVTAGGSGTPGPLVSIPGFISASDPGYTVNIYTNFHNYTVPGPAVWDGAEGAGGAAPGPATTLATVVVPAPATTAAQPVAPETPAAALYGQCGGTGWTGATTCAAGVCTESSAYYSQCLPASS